MLGKLGKLDEFRRYLVEFVKLYAELVELAMCGELQDKLDMLGNLYELTYYSSRMNLVNCKLSGMSLLSCKMSWMRFLTCRKYCMSG